MAARDAGVDRLDLDASHRLGGVHRFADRTHGPLDVRDDAFAEAPAGHVADTQDGDAIRVHFADDGAHLGAAEVEADDDFGGARGGHVRQGSRQDFRGFSAAVLSARRCHAGETVA